MYKIYLLRWKYLNMSVWARKNNIDFPTDLVSFKYCNPSEEQIKKDFLILKNYECESYFDFLYSFNWITLFFIKILKIPYTNKYEEKGLAKFVNSCWKYLNAGIMPLLNNVNNNVLMGPIKPSVIKGMILNFFTPSEFILRHVFPNLQKNIMYIITEIINIILLILSIIYKKI